MHGQFVLTFPNGKEIILPNTVVDEGEDAYLKMLFRADATFVAGGGNFYIGLCDQIPVETDNLAAIGTEPGATGGYARLAVTRDAVGWPTIDTVNGRQRIISKQITFTATGADFDAPFSRAFMCNVASGSAGTLFSFSGALSQAITLLDTQSFTMRYEVFLD
jgi:hypothetical protein